ncbi:exonuclease, DNA polymerase III, epsilon subunit family domain protein, partial [Vibrio parahaemolyticus EKP-008]
CTNDGQALALNGRRIRKLRYR